MQHCFEIMSGSVPFVMKRIKLGKENNQCCEELQQGQLLCNLT